MSSSILPTTPATRLVLLRHGQTDWNLAGRFQGHLDVALNDAGREQARQAASMVAAEGIEVIVSSDLSRARDTAAELSAVTGRPVELDARLQEINVGSWGGMSGAEMAEREPGLALALAEGRDFRRSPSGETADEVGTRMRLALTEIAARHEGRCVAVVSHGLAIRMACGYLLGWDFAHTWQLGPMRNCGWSVLVRTAERPWRLEAYNRFAPPLPPL